MLAKSGRNILGKKGTEVSVEKFPRGIEFRSCPGCGHVESQLLIDRSIVNFKCPRCQQYHLSDFEPWPQPETDPPKPGKRKTA